MQKAMIAALAIRDVAEIVGITDIDLAFGADGSRYRGHICQRWIIGVDTRVAAVHVANAEAADGSHRGLEGLSITAPKIERRLLIKRCQFSRGLHRASRFLFEIEWKFAVGARRIPVVGLSFNVGFGGARKQAPDQSAYAIAEYAIAEHRRPLGLAWSSQLVFDLPVVV